MKRFRLSLLLTALMSMEGMSAWADSLNAAPQNGSSNITFADAAVKAICVENWDDDGDGEISYSEAESVTTIGEVFRGNQDINSFNELQYFTGINSIPDYAFYYSSLAYVTLPNSLTSIGQWAFSNCGVRSINIPASVTTIKKAAMNSIITVYANWVSPPTLPIYGIDTHAMVFVPSGTKEAYVAAGWDSWYGGIVELGSPAITFAYNVVKLACVGKWDFDGDGEISYSEAAAVKRVGGNLFKDIYVPFSFDELQFFTSSTSISGLSSSYLTSVIIPNSVTTIDYRAFSGCSGLTSIDIPNSVTTIGDGAFQGCSGLTSIDIPNSVTTIDISAFSGCSGLTSIDFPNSVTTIGSGAFSGCSGLTSIDIPNSVTQIGEEVFSGCSNLNSVTIDMTNIGKKAFYGLSNLASLTFGNSVTSIGNEAFSGCSGLKSIDIPNSVTQIGEGAFFGCSGLTSVTIGNSVTIIGSSAFYNCSGLTSIDIPNSVTTIGICAFSHCSGLTSIDIPNSVISIGQQAFDNCSGLTSIDIPNSVISIGPEAFAFCSRLTSIEIPNSVTMIGSNLFRNCSGLTSIQVALGNTTYDSRNDCNAIIETASNTLIVGSHNSVIPNTVTSIGRSAFFECRTLTNIYIPNSVTSIGDWAFSHCSGLTSVTVMWETPVQITSNVFRDIEYIRHVTLYVPYGCKDAYSAADYWKDFNIVEMSSEQLISATGISLDRNTLTFDACGQTATLTSTITPANATLKNVIWLSSNTDVATVDNNGVVTAVGNGSAVITAKTKDGTNLTAQCNVTVDVQTVSITIATNSGSAREAIGYSSEYGLDFTNVTDVKAYVATGFTDDGDVLLSRIYIVPAKTGVYLKSVAGAGITVTVPTTAKYVLYANLLKPYIGTGTLAASETIDGVTYKNYVVGTKDGKPSFAIWGGGTFGPHKAYMPIPDPLVPAAAARAGGFSVKYIDEEPTAIEETIGCTAPASDTLYDLQGRKVSNAKRGIYVRNGKKIFIK